MLKAVLRKGIIVPLQPVPAEWAEGTTLEIARAEDGPADVDAWALSMNQLCADTLDEDESVMRQAIEEHRQQAKNLIHREMGLAP